MKECLKVIISENIRVLRGRAKLSQAKLAKAAGISKGYIGSIETGRKHPSVSVLEKLAKALGVPPYRLFKAERILWKHAALLCILICGQIWKIRLSKPSIQPSASLIIRGKIPDKSGT